MEGSLPTKTICVTQVTEIKTYNYLSSLEDMIVSVFFLVHLIRRKKKKHFMLESIQFH